MSFFVVFHTSFEFGLELLNNGLHSAFGEVGDTDIHQSVDRIVEQRVDIESDNFGVLLDILLDEHWQTQIPRFEFID